MRAYFSEYQTEIEAALEALLARDARVRIEIKVDDSSPPEDGQYV